MIVTGDSGGDRKLGSIYPPFYEPAVKARDEVLPSIDDFLDELPLIDEFTETAFPEDPYYAGFDDDHDEGFGEDYDTGFPLLDEVAASGQGAGDYPLASPADSTTAERDANGWAVDEWQRYDWSSISSLGRPSADRAAADADWGATEWSSAAPGGSDHMLGGQAQSLAGGAGPTAHEVAMALDDIARRIRSGELLIDQFRGSPPEAAMAAVLAALLRTRG